MGILSRKFRGLALVWAGLVTGCGGLGAPGPAIHLYDLGAAPLVTPGQGSVGAVRVAAPSWLKSPALSYRLLYEAPGERRSYQYSRWVAPPPELLGSLLGRGLAGRGGCTLEVDVDEFIQVFPSPQQSEGVIEARARLRHSQDGALLAARAFSVRVPAPSADGPGGAAALAQGSRDLAGAIGTWLASPSGQQGGGENERCTRTNG